MGKGVFGVVVCKVWGVKGLKVWDFGDLGCFNWGIEISAIRV